MKAYFLDPEEVERVSSAAEAKALGNAVEWTLDADVLTGKTATGSRVSALGLWMVVVGTVGGRLVSQGAPCPVALSALPEDAAA